VNLGFAYSTAELIAAVAANGNFNTCELTHPGDAAPAHKEPVIAELQGYPADFGGSRSLLHARGPDSVWRTAAVGVSD